MSNQGNKYMVGMLTVVSLGLLILILVSFGILNSFKKKYRFMTAVKTSVQGLEKGAKVKFKGVTIGTVKKIQVSLDGDIVLIYMEMNPQSVAKHISSDSGTWGIEDDQEKFNRFIADKIKEGARCQLRYGGITGNLYIEIGMYDPEKYPVKNYNLPEGHPPYIPSVPPVLIENIMGTLHEALQHIAQIDINKIVQDIDDTIKKVNVTLDEINRGIKDAQIGKISNSMNDFLVTSNNTVKEIAQLRKNVEESLLKANALMTSAQNLVEYLEAHPSSIIHGRQDEPVIEH
jgi:ABC-type transporter Mla subunit MlaD